MNKRYSNVRKSIITITISMMVFSAHAELFKWKDADGNLIYSDQPPPGIDQTESEITKEELPEIISVPAPKVSNTTDSRTPKSSKETVKYKELTIVTPVHDEAIRENSGNVQISVRVLPDNFSESGAMLAIYMDGLEISKGSETTVQLINVDRGTHTVKAELMNSAGHVVKATRPTVFHLLRHHN